MNIPYYNDIAGYLQEEKKVRVPPSLYNKYEFFYNFFSNRPYNEDNVEALLSVIKNNNRYQPEIYNRTILNEYVFIIKCVSEYNKYRSQNPKPTITYTIKNKDNATTLMKFPSWENFKNYLIVERHIKVRSNIKSPFTYITKYFCNRPYSKSAFRQMLEELRSGVPGKTPIVNATLNKYIQCAKHIENFLNINVIQDLKKYPVNMSNKEKVIMTDEQMEAIASLNIERTRYYEEDNLKYKTMFQVLRFSGMRTSELLNLKWSDYKGDYFEIFATKTNQKRIIPMPKFVCEMINKLNTGSSEYIFVSRQTNGKIKMDTLNEELHRRTKLLGLSNKITVYNFRYTFDTLCSLGGNNKSLSQIAKITGHTMETAQKYYLQYNVSDLRQALESSHPGLKKQSGETNDLKGQVIAKINELTDDTKLQAILCLL